MNPEDPLPDPTQLSRIRNHRIGANCVEKVLEMLVHQCIDKKLLKPKGLIIDATLTHANTQKQEAIEVLKDAAKRLVRAITKKHPKLQKKLPVMPKLTGASEDRAKILLHHLAELGETVEALLPDAEGSILEKLRFAKQIVEDERLLARKGIMSTIDPDARFGWKSNAVSFFGYKESCHDRRGDHNGGCFYSKACRRWKTVAYSTEYQPGD